VDELQSLSEAPIDETCVIRELNARPETSQRLRELGMSEMVAVRPVVKNRTQMICEVHNTRIGLRRRIARRIVVSPTDR